MPFEISGYSPLVPVWVWLLFLIAAIFMSWITYKNYQSIPLSGRFALSSLRIFSLLILLILLLNPNFQKTIVLEDKPQIAILIDNSASIDIDKGTWQGRESMEDILSVIRNIDTTSVRLSLKGFDRARFDIGSPDELNFSASGTDIFNSLSPGTDLDRIKRILMITDGISTVGRDPVFAARSLGIPVFTLAVGDTTNPRDIILQSVEAPASAFTNTTIAVSATVRNEGFPNRTLQVRLTGSNGLMEMQEIATRSDRSTHQVTFQIPLEEEGLKNYAIEVVPVAGEWTTENNRTRFQIEVTDNQVRVLYLAFELHPDVGAFRRVLRSNPAIKLDERNWVQNTRFAEGSLPTRRDTLDLIIVHGLPAEVPAPLMDQIASFTSEIPVVFVYTPGSSQSRISQLLGTDMPFRTSSGLERSPIHLIPSSQQTGHPILDLPVVDWNRTPPLQSPVGNIQTSDRSTSLFYASIRNNVSSTPVIRVSEIGNNRKAALLFSGFFQWFLSSEGLHREVMDQLLTNVVVWTSADIDDNLLSITTSQSSYDSGENIIFSARVIDGAGNPESNAEVTLQISGSNGEERQFALTSSGSGQYTLTIPGLPEDEYTFSATAISGNQLLGERSGGFSVGGSSEELLVTVRNDQVLQGLARQTEGDFSTWEDAEALINRFVAGSENEVTTNEINVAVQLNRNPLWFLLLIVFLGAEWLLRKRYVLP